MLNITYELDFLDTIRKIKDKPFKEKVKKQVENIISNPEVGKPMRYTRKGTRELYIKPYRIAYAYIQKENQLIFLKIYHKDKQ